MKKQFLAMSLAIGMIQGCSSLNEISNEVPAAVPSTTKIPVEAEVEPQQAQAKPQLALPTVEKKKLPAELLYHLTLAEVAAQRGKLDLAVQYYFAAAKLSRDPKIAERTTRIAMYAQDNASAYEAANLWVSVDTDNMEAHQLLATMLVRLGRTQEAFEHFDYVLSHSEQDQDNQFMIIVSLLSKHKDKKVALEVMNQLVAKRRQQPLALYAQSQLAMLLGQLDISMDAINKALVLRPEWAEANMLRANILARQGQNAAAVEFLANVVEQYPTSVRLRMFYARKLVDEKHYKQAREQFERVLEAAPDNDDALYSLGLIGLQDKDFSYAQEKFRQLIQKGERVSESNYFLGQIAEIQENYVEAKRRYSEVGAGKYYFEAQIGIAALLAKQDKLAQAREHLRSINTQTAAADLRINLIEGEMLYQAKQFQQAFDLYTKALADMPENSQLLYSRALVAEKLNMLDIVESDLKQVIQREPTNAQALNALGYTLADHNYRLEEALGYIMRAYKISPDDAAIIDSLGWIHYRMGNYEIALKNLRRAFSMQNDPEIAAHLGEVLWVSGQQQSARSVWDEALDSSPHHEALLQVIQRLTQ